MTEPRTSKIHPRYAPQRPATQRYAPLRNVFTKTDRDEFEYRTQIFAPLRFAARRHATQRNATFLIREKNQCNESQQHI